MVVADLKKAANPLRVAQFVVRTCQQLKYCRERKKLVCLLTGCEGPRVDQLIKQVGLESPFVKALAEKYAIRKFNRGDFELSKRAGTMFFNCVTLYLLVRLLRPECVVETGGTPGKSSAFILQAMAENDCGCLYTLDLPPPETPKRLSEFSNDFPWHKELPRGMQTGWIVPDRLKERQTIICGNTGNTLKPLLNKLHTIDWFIHDSDHSYENMKFEFETAFPSVRPGGLLISDDIDHNRSFDELAAENGCYSKKMPYFGIVRK
ncbi:MAG: class I SAM-dependent methyltransferase [Desulfobacterales bacterium]|nr:MAG: class I SAM-dependent methyltransferase [Desulfobacterales bacterium]